MNVRPIYKWCVVGTVLALGLSFGLNTVLVAQQPAPAAAEEGVEVLTRGPVHEAFAETVTYDPEPGVVVPNEPPATIEEVPPEQRLEGDHVAWIPGYWAWDDERDDFLWVSGIWRALPPGRQWVPGYWSQAGEAFQWTSGYWADAQADEAEYLPEPPASVETGPNIASPSPDHTWLPGCWMWQNSRYAWRPGFWATAHPNWAWVPAHYVWTPRGYVFVDGYWDHSIARRGVLFAPVYFNRSVYSRRGFSYSPRTVINLGALTNHLFLRPRYQHYYFGDYYAPSYRSAGYYPWFSINTASFGYDPIYAHDRWQNRRDSGWDRRLETNFLSRRDNESIRPPRTWADQRLLGASEATSEAGLPRVASLLDDVRGSKDSPQRFQKVDSSQRQQYRQHAQDVQQLRDERQKLETRAVDAQVEKPAKETKEGRPARVKLPRSPIVAKPAADLEKDQAPPKTYDAPQPDPKVEPKRRATRPSAQPQERTTNRMPLDEPRTTSQPQPKAERQTRQPKVERQTPQAKPERQTPQPKVERQTRQPKVERQTPQPKAERQTPQAKAQRRAPQPKAEKPAAQARIKDRVDAPASRAKQDKRQGKDKE